MILVDTSIWIEFLKGTLHPKPQPDDLLLCVTCGPVIQEVLQGLREGRASDRFRSSFLALPALSDPLGQELYLEAADIFQHGRRRGITVRSSTDCLIAAIAIKNKVPVWHRDRDFTMIEKYTALKVVDRK